MSRGGGGSRGGSAAASGVRAIANVLGISRQEIGQFTAAPQVRNEPIPLYPPLARDPLPLEESKELTFMTDTKQEFLHRFRESPFYHKRTGKRDVRRYTDKYKLLDKEPFEPYWERLPAELNWKAGKKSADIFADQRNAAKRARLDENILLERLGQREKQTEIKEEADKEDETRREDHDEEDEGDEGAIKPPRPTNEDEEEVEYSDEDYLLEGGNDYVDSYFDGGDDFEEEGNALDDEGAY